MKTKILIVTLFMFLSALVFQSFSYVDYCEEMYNSKIDAANSEYNNDQDRCAGTWVSKYKCNTEAAYSYEQNVTEAYYAFNECYNKR